MPSHATQPFAHQGGILLPSTSALARTAFGLGQNKILGDVFEMPANPRTWRYTLKRTAGLTNLENLEVYFAADNDGAPAAQGCNDPNRHEPDPSTETGVVASCGTAESRWAIVVIDPLSLGANASFTFSLTN